MPNRRSLLILACSIALSLVVSGCTGRGAGPSHPRAPGSVSESGDDGLEEELQEQTEGTAERLEALEAARDAGTLGLTAPLRSEPAPGWAGERVVNDTGDDWEPAVAADPNRPFVYILHNRYGASACNACPDPAMILQVSRDGGTTWGSERFLCDCRGFNGQFDPLIEVVPDTGAVDAVWMNGFNVYFAGSSDHGRTWSEAVPVMGDVNWGDKPNFATSADGQDVYIAFNGPTNGDPYVATSHDAGATWTQVNVTTSDRYFFAYGAHVSADGTVNLSHISFTYTGQGDTVEGPVLIHDIRSTDGGATWTDIVIDDTLERGTPCTSRGCYANFYDSGPALAADAADNLVLVYNGAATPDGPRTVFSRSSTDGGLTWTDPVTISKVGVNAGFPAAAGRGDEIDAYFMDERAGRWSVRYVTSTDLGLTWTAPVRISDARSGTEYKDPKGFVEVYGDYGEMAITSAGATIAVWGEGLSYFGPGGCGSTARPSARGAREPAADQRSTSPTTKKTDPRIEMRSGTRLPGSIAGSTDTLENDAVRIFRRYGSFFPLPTT